MTASQVHAKAAGLGKLAVRMTTRAGSGHPSSALSLAHIVTHLLYCEMKFDAADPWSPSGDRLVLSEGHAVPIVYAAWADMGGAIGPSLAGGREGSTLSVSELDHLRALPSVLDGHPNPAEGFPFFDAATGSLGMGLSVAAGLALAARQDGSPRRVFVIIGDGESREGQIWEAADFIVDHKLTGVCAIFNCNGQGQAADVSPQQSPEKLSAKLIAFGWNAVTIDGHDPAAIEQAFSRHTPDAPLAILARTVKGWGVDGLRKGNWHGKPLTEADLSDADASLDRTIAGLGASAADFAVLRRTQPAIPARPRTPEPRKEAAWPSFADAMRGAGLGGALEKNQLATRRAYGAALKAAGDLLPRVVALDADVSNSTFSEMFARAHPQRFYECKIAEQNMVSVAAGLSAAGYVPFANSFAKFISRAYDQVELAAISRANIKLVGSHAGISLAADGPSQMAVVDMAFFGSFTGVRADDRRSPICWVFNPADAVTAFQATRWMTSLHGLCYMRTYRPDVPLLYAPDAQLELGGFGHFNPGGDLALVSGGYMTHVVKRAAEILARQGVRATLIDLYCLPVAGERLLDAIRRSGGRALVAEDNYGGGLSAAVCELAARDGGIRAASLYCQRMPKSARTAEEILGYCGVGAEQVADQAMSLLRRS